MVKAWYMSEDEGDQRDEHHLEPPEFVDIDSLKKSTGVLYWHDDPAAYETSDTLAKLRKERGYSYMDIISISPDKLPNYEEKIKIFFREHLHTDEEVRFCLEGNGYFDIREDDERWIRIKMEPGDLLVMPAGIYHRFTLDHNNYIKALRLFVGEPVWTPHDRPADDMEARKEYVHQMEKGF